MRIAIKQGPIRAALALGFLTHTISPAFSFSIDYTYSILGGYGPSGSCVSSIQVANCFYGFSSTGANSLAPDPGFMVGGWNAISLTALAKDGHVSTSASGMAQFGVLASKSKLLAVYASSDGQHTVRDEIPNEGGGIAIYQASAYTYASTVVVKIKDELVASIPAAYDGQAVSASITIPISAIGTGSSWGDVLIRAGGTSDSRRFGRLNEYADDAWSEDSDIKVSFTLRSGSDSRRKLDVPMELQGVFNSSSLNGPGFIDALNTVGFSIASFPGVGFESENSAFNALLNPVPEPETYALLLAGIGLVGLAARRRKRA